MSKYKKNRTSIEVIFILAVFFICAPAFAEVPPPYLHVSLDDGYGATE